jgi:uncharacterized protein
MSLILSKLFVYPIKSCAGFETTEAEVTDRGLKYDRRWMLTSPDGTFLTLREFPKMALLQATIDHNNLIIKNLETNSSLTVSIENYSENTILSTIWNAQVTLHTYSNQVNSWFSEQLGAEVILGYMTDSNTRIVDTTSGYKPAGKLTSMADAYPFLLLSEESLNDLNSRMDIPQSILRFRPNLVIKGDAAYVEDTITIFKINDVLFEGLENCARCGIPNVDPSTGILDPKKEPLRTLSKYRLRNKNIEFGRNVVHTGVGKIAVGDSIILL